MWATSSCLLLLLVLQRSEVGLKIFTYVLCVSAVPAMLSIGHNPVPCILG